MSIHPQRPGTKGSLKHIQHLVNVFPGLLENEVNRLLPPNQRGPIEWVSPLAANQYAEYRDGDFLRVLGLAGHEAELARFWPKHGPQWDALGRSSDTGENGEPQRVFLVEAKAHVAEICSPPCKATGSSSSSMIRDALTATRTFVRSSSEADWLGYFYQYVNRLAHLYFLREVLHVDAYLVFLYFLDDKDVSGPTSRKEWRRRSPW